MDDYLRLITRGQNYLQAPCWTSSNHQNTRTATPDIGELVPVVLVMASRHKRAAAGAPSSYRVARGVGAYLHESMSERQGTPWTGF
ncbi:hypothetical protein ATANTOWER_027996 [Ataeniobius toweri]|uniref:Uncharacterized protein n=1 Tax=Ataeniobius toweri TaxID=208326 RepID=A0ABU7AU92_9TELE|nr:hypothetical protein [Ataeniobius toweri]